MRIIGLDPGERRVGVAVSDPSGTIASPERYIDTVTEDMDQELLDLCASKDATLIVVGLPISLDGTEGVAATKARAFGERVHAVTGIEVVFSDERFSTHTAERALIEGGVRRSKRRTRRDQVAAAVMLQAFLDRSNQRDDDS
ncbi:MAG: Holliday junction resolvase RuvX [Acidimicrobiia bacterium]